MKPILQAKKLRKLFSDIEILKEIDLEVFPGESVAIIGKSGSGKSTLLHILGTLSHPTSGELFISGKEAFSHKEALRKKSIGFLFQSFHLLEDYTLLENVLMPAKIAREPIYKSSPAYIKALTLLKEMELEDKANLPVKLLSGGEKQRSALARAFCNNPDLLLVDEPTGNLDRINAQKVQTLLINCFKKQKKSLILVTHDEDFASLCDRVYLLKDGLLTPHR